MIAICSEFSKEYDVIFNSAKRKIVYISCNGKTENINIEMDNTSVPQEEYEQHLGNWIGNISVKENVEYSVSEFNKRVNMILLDFKYCDSVTKYTLNN